jgi:23S rRNA pseudouridine1911/1915/1917 synthase
LDDPRGETFLIAQSLPAERLDAFLRTRYPSVSRATIQRLIEQGHITINGRAVKPAHHPRAGEEVSVCWPEPKPMVATPQPIPLPILYEDADLLVIDKPAGLITHPGTGYEEHTLVNALLYHCAGNLSGIGGVLRPGIVHRLDKPTSGCLVVAKSDAAHMALQRQFSERSLEKIYLAITCGQVPLVTGEIRAAIARHPTQRKRMAAVDEEKGGRQAHTSYRVRERLREATLLEAKLHTGRTHQIRVHFQHLGHPLLGDETYGARQNQRLAELTGYHPPRLMLHSWKLAFTHPRTRRLVPCEAPVPEDFKQAVQALRLDEKKQLKIEY